ncbi:restriction endonuclease subunit S [Nocardia gipuzkoensis]|uniref:restriction endonuclease subunit S n=1 Tax=Nocardia gipuzkoensis TaxID=2749991 RepID=UPI00237D649A|nr:restriction endonuclease subunit S [Nocardia gipuzkoensis]MDE1675184.1 restriction endonuclease subunit S [Nocardia gipuzkoensis]
MSSLTLIGAHRAVSSLLETRPKSWDVVRFKGLFDRLDQRNSDLSYEMLSLRSTGEVVARAELGGRQEPDEISLPKYLVAEIDDLVVNPMWLIGGGIGVCRRAGAVSPDYRVFRSRGALLPRFIHYLLRSQPYLDQYRLYTRAQTTFDRRVQQPDLDNLPIPVPPSEEQRAIADYLDRETARVDTLIEEQQRLIAMLRERREATIRSALLSGLDDAETAPSGVELLGAVPKHWRMVPTRYLCRITTGSEDSGNATDDGEYPFYVRGREVLRIDHYSFEGEAVMTPGDGQGGTGKVFHYFDGKFEAHQRVYVFTDFADVTGGYFYYFLSTFLRPVALAGSNTVTMESLRRPLLADFKIAVPPIDEQQRITAYLDDQTAKIDTVIAEADRFIDLARERRSALITAAVTGEIDVRELPDG